MSVNHTTNFGHMTINIGVRSSIARGAESSIKDVPLQVAQHHTLGGEVVVEDPTGLYEKTIIDYGLPGPEDSERRPPLPLLKLHGSLNWFRKKDSESGVEPLYLYPDLMRLTARDEELGYKIIDPARLAGERLDLDEYESEPVVVPPTWNKTGHYEEMQGVWACAAEELSEAESIIVSGFSLPETDSFFRYLFALGTAGPTRVKRFWVFDPDRRVEDRFRALVGRHVERCFEYCQVGFSDAIKELQVPSSVIEVASSRPKPGFFCLFKR